MISAMYRSLTVISFLTLTLFFIPSVVHAEEGEEMSTVVKSIKDALQESANVKIDGFNLPLKTVKVELNTIVAKKTGGGFNFWIFSFGVDKEKENTSTVAIQLTAPKPQGTPLSTFDPSKLTHALSGAIIEAKRNYVAASRIDSKLSEGKVTLGFKFLVKSVVRGGVKITEIIPIGIDANGSYSKSQVHTITLEFAA